MTFNPVPKKKPKYGNEVDTRSGRSFSSKGEARLFDYLQWLEKAGEIEIIQTQANVHLTDARILYVPDFKLKNLKTEEIFYAEFKGFETTDWRIKRRLWKSYGPGKLDIYNARGSSVALVETIIPKGKGE